MSLIDGFMHRLRVLLRPHSYDREIAEEQAFHVEMQAMHFAHESHGELSDDDARRQARRRYGNMARHKEEVRTVSGLGGIEMVRQDLRFAWRSFMRTPAFTIVAVATLALGIGGNTAIFSALDALLFRPLPFAEPERLMKVSLTRAAFGEAPANDDALWSYPKFVTFRNAQKIFSSIALHAEDQATLRIDGDAERIRDEITDSKYFVTLGVQPMLGRLFAAEEDSIGEGQRVVILSHVLWQRRFNADSAVIGRTH